MDAHDRDGSGRPSSGALEALFAPASVAVIGASDDIRKWGNWLAKGALAGPVPVHLVNARADVVLGRPAVPSLVQAGLTADLAVVAVPASAFEAAVDDALAAGARAIVGISAGLGETGPEGIAREQAVVVRVQAAGAVLLGPNCLGVSDAAAGLSLTSNPLPPGDVAFISQSGNLSLELAKLLDDYGLGFSRFASLGNQAHLDAADLVEATVLHASTKVIAVYCEDFRDGRRFVQAALDARNSGKAVVLLTVGSSEASARQASSHTASLVTSSDVVDAACAAGGIVRVNTPSQMVDAIALLRESPMARGRNVAIITDGGGHAAIAADVAESLDLNVVHFTDSLAATVAADLPAAATSVNPIDVAGGGEQDLSCFGRVVHSVLTSGEVDAMVVSGYFGGYGQYGEALADLEVATAGALADAVTASGRPLVVHSMYPLSAAATVLRRRGVPVYRTIEGALVALGESAGVEPLGLSPIPEPESQLPAFGYWEVRSALVEAGVQFPDAQLVSSDAELESVLPSLQFPVVLKAMGLLHKTDVGGVRLGIIDVEELRAEYRSMVDRLDPPAVTVEHMVDTTSGVELIVGVRQDARFGPVAMVGGGGILTEVLDDVATSLAPVDASRATDLLRTLRTSALLDGVRGRPAVDVDAVAQQIAAIVNFACTHPEIADFEVNPLLATASGAVALDARAIAAG
ncbi:MAG: acetate--CoA ligase family protein [Actinomycetia bacterium]|nr:acetate--CoA ligase family protein [Actinomycetes bacterium]